MSPARRFAAVSVGVVLATTLSIAAEQGGADTAARPRSTVARVTPPRTVPPRILPGTRPNVFSIIQGNALSPANGALPNMPMRLRDARFGQIVDLQLTDKSGLFTFRTVDPGSYVVEILGSDQYTVLAASQILNVGSGEAVSAVVKLPFRISPMASVLGYTPQSASIVTTQAAASGALGVIAAGTPTCAIIE